MLSIEELRLLDTACGDRRNEAVRVLQNAFGVNTASGIMKQIVDAPVAVRGDLMTQVRMAIDEQKRRPDVLRSAPA